MKSKSVDYDGPFDLAVFLCGSITSEGHASFQSPFYLDTRRKGGGKAFRGRSHLGAKIAE